MQFSAQVRYYYKLLPRSFGNNDSQLPIAGLVGIGGVINHDRRPIARP